MAPRPSSLLHFCCRQTPLPEPDMASSLLFLFRLGLSSKPQPQKPASSC